MSRLTLREIAQEAALLAGLPLADLMARSPGDRPLRMHARARQRAAWAMRITKPDASSAQIGQALGGLDHSSIRAAFKTVELRRFTDPAEADACSKLLAAIRAREEMRAAEAARFNRHQAAFEAGRKPQARAL